MAVEQCDRVAAAAYMKLIRSSRWSVDGIFDGSCDNSYIVRAFTDHRLAERERCAGIAQADKGMTKDGNMDYGPNVAARIAAAIMDTPDAR